MDARRQKLGADSALALVAEVDEIYACKGKKVVHVDLRRETPSRDALRQLLLGPTGNLRAPTLRRGRTLVVGFDGDTYSRVFG